MSNDTSTLYTSNKMEKNSLKTQKKKGKKVILGPADYDIRVIPIPVKKDKEIRGYLSHRLSVIYPWNQEEMDFDYIRQGNQVLVYLVRKDRLFDWSLGKKSFWSMESALCRGSSKGKAFIIQQDHIEWLAWEEGKVVEIRNGLVDDFFPVKESLKWDEASIFLLGPPTEKVGNFLGMIPVSVKSVKELPPASFEDRLFSPRKKQRPWTLLFLLPCLIFFLWSIQRTWYDRMSSCLETRAALQEQIDRIHDLRSESSKIEDEIMDVKNQLQVLKDSRSPVLTGLFTELSRVWSGDAVLENITWQEGLFTLQVTGENPLELKNRLEYDFGFSDLEIGQITPTEDGSSRFSLRGRFYAP